MQTPATNRSHIQLSLELNNEPRVDSRLIAKGISVEHNATMKLIKRYQAEFEELGILGFQIEEIKGRGQPAKFVLLNESQATFLLTLSKNTKQVVGFKLKLTKEFEKLRKAAEQRASLDWQQLRQQGKHARRIETDTIKLFVNYAIDQGSTSAGKYYMNLTKMTYRALFFVEQGLKMPRGLRDMLDCSQLAYLTTAEFICEKALRDGMDMKLPYKNIYLLAKERIEAYSKTIGKTPALPKDRSNYYLNS